METHKLKIKQLYAIKHFEKKKHWELRYNDRNFKVNDLIEFFIIETGVTYKRKIVYIYKNEIGGLKDNFIILSLELMN